MATKSKQTLKQPLKSAASKVNQAAKAQASVALKGEISRTVRAKPGQPTKFTPELWEDILVAVATYQDLIEICTQDNMPAVSTIYRWMRESPELKQDMREAWEMFSMLGKSYNNNILRQGIMSTGDFRRDEALVSDNRWFMGKTNRRDFGDRQQVDLNSTVSISVPSWAARIPDQGATPLEPPSLDGELIDPDEVYERETLGRLTSPRPEADTPKPD